MEGTIRSSDFRRPGITDEKIDEFSPESDGDNYLHNYRRYMESGSGRRRVMPQVRRTSTIPSTPSAENTGRLDTDASVGRSGMTSRTGSKTATVSGIPGAGNAGNAGADANPGGSRRANRPPIPPKYHTWKRREGIRRGEVIAGYIKDEKQKSNDKPNMSTGKAEDIHTNSERGGQSSAQSQYHIKPEANTQAINQDNNNISKKEHVKGKIKMTAIDGHEVDKTNKLKNTKTGVSNNGFVNNEFHEQGPGPVITPIPKEDISVTSFRQIQRYWMSKGSIMGGRMQEENGKTVSSAVEQSASANPSTSDNSMEFPTDDEYHPSTPNPIQYHQSPAGPDGSQTPKTEGSSNSPLSKKDIQSSVRDKESPEMEPLMSVYTIHGPPDINLDSIHDSSSIVSNHSSIPGGSTLYYNDNTIRTIKENPSFETGSRTVYTYGSSPTGLMAGCILCIFFCILMYLVFILLIVLDT